MKKWIAIALIFVMVLGLAGCKKTGNEESALGGEYVEGEKQEMSGDTPDKAEDIVNTLTPDQTPSDKAPSQENESETPSEENKQENVDQNQGEAPSDDDNGNAGNNSNENSNENSDNNSNGNSDGSLDIMPDEPEQETPSQKPVVKPEDEIIHEEGEVEEEGEEGEEDEENEEDEDDSYTPPVNNSTANNSAANTLKIVSYNVRCSDDPQGTVAERAVRFKKSMDIYKPDIMGLQEVNAKWLPILEKDFSATYSYINVWRAAKSTEGTPIFWKKDKFTLVDSGTFWLSETPNEESKSYDSNHYRICNWVKLKIKATGKVFLFLNTHLDTVKAAQVPQANVLLAQAKALGAFTQYGVFCTGDFNAQPTEAAYKTMTTQFADINKSLDDIQTPTYTKYQTSKPGKIIDYCFISYGKIVPISYRVIDEYIDGGYASDHSGLYIEAKVA